MHSHPGKSGTIALRFALCVVAALVLASCATGYGAGRGGGGYGQPYPGNAYVDVVGTVIGLERGYERIVLERHGDGYDDYRDRAGQVEIRYNPQTTLYFEGRVQPVEALERGDVIRIEG